MRIQRTLAPTAAPLAVHDLLHGLAGIFLGEKQLMKLEGEIQDYFRVKHVFLVSSGKAALTLILVALKSLSSRQHVVIPAYTCFSVPSAIVKAGLNVSLCDVDPQSLDFNFDCLQSLIDANPLCVIPTHLLGLPSNVDRVKGLCQDKGVFVVEDVAQAMGVKHGGRFLGTRGDVAFFSLGRGKNITCGSGGIIVTNCDLIAQALRKEYQRLTPEPTLGIIRNFCEVLALCLLIDPRLYWLPAGLPFLRLGETKFYHDFPIHRMDGVRASLLSRWKDRLLESNASHSKVAADFHDRLPRGCQVVAPVLEAKVLYNRMPVMMRSKRDKDELVAASKANGLGISPLYPSAIPDIEELKGSFMKGRFPAAEQVVNCLVTLPIHQFVRPKDVERICCLVGQLHEAAEKAGMSSDSRSLASKSASVQV